MADEDVPPIEKRGDTKAPISKGSSTLNTRSGERVEIKGKISSSIAIGRILEKN